MSSNVGRFDRELRFQLPTRDSRKEILKVHTRDWNPQVPETLVRFLSDFLEFSRFLLMYIWLFCLD
jgi:SpoVK/Ycf46/Vps4 family AAA+-type ATPase